MTPREKRYRVLILLKLFTYATPPAKEMPLIHHGKRPCVDYSEVGPFGVSLEKGRKNLECREKRLQSARTSMHFYAAALARASPIF